jgi:cytochrome c oxidase cbb3-type subunit 3
MVTQYIRKVGLFVLSASLLVAGLQIGARARADDDAKWAATEKLYNTYCVQCHGMNRNGKGINAKSMPVQPRDHSDPKGMGAIPDSEIVKAITYGGLSVNKSVLMPAWGKVLSAQQIQDLAAYIRHVCQCGAEAKH